MERGFKARCEQMAKSLRLAIGIGPTDPLHPLRLARFLNVHVLSLDEIGLSKADFRQLAFADSDSWSAITVTGFGKEAIIPNPSHTGGRHASNVIHELAHLILGHKPSTVFFVGDNADIALRGYDRSIEDEANWLGATLLLPRNVLTSCKSRKVPNERICLEYGVSRQMLKFRLDVTGVNRQFQRRPS